MMKFDNVSKVYIDRISNDCILSDNKFIKIYNFFILNNYTISTNLEDAEIIILDLCGVNSSFLVETYKKIDMYLELKKTIFLFGCITPVIKDKYLNKINYVTSNDYLDLEKHFNFKLGIDKINSFNHKDKITILDTDSVLKNYGESLPNFDKKAFIEISTGCQMNCTYCNIKKIKGDTKSSTIKTILQEIEQELNKGKTDIYLLSDDCGSYGVDIGTDFSELLDSIFLLSEEIKVFITNIYPSFFIRFYPKIKKYIQNGKIPYILLPVQHTSERILKSMNRYYSIDSLEIILKEIKQNADVELVNHIIFDYDSESIEELAGTFNLMKYYSKTFYFRYSDINNLYKGGDRNTNIKEKVILLKKMQKMYNIDLMF